MSSPSLQDIVTHEPGIATIIDQMTELIPGVLASQANLKTLLEYVVKKHQLMIANSDDISIEIVVNKHRKKKELSVFFHGKREVWRFPSNRACDQRPCLSSDLFECTEDGLLKALIHVKHSKKRYREEGPCPDCDRSDETEFPKKRMKAKGMPKCEDCMFRAIVM